MRALWKGAIAFGLVNIPVSLNPAEEVRELKFSMIDSRDDSKIKYKKVNEKTGEEVPKENVARAYEFDNGEYVVMTDEDFEKADPVASKTIEIETFIDKEDLSLMYPEKPYYIAPQKGAEKPYVILREAMKKTGKIAIARIVIKTREYLAALHPDGDILVLDIIRFHHEIRSAENIQIPESVSMTDKENELAKNLIESMAGEWKPEEYEDRYTEAVMKRIEAKARRKGEEIPEEEPKEEPKKGKVVNILDLLQQSVDAQKTGKKASR